MNIATLLEMPAMLVPDSVAVVDQDEEHTYAALQERVGRAASLLEGYGVGPGDRVGIFAVNSVDLLTVLFATAAVGAVVVPMNYRAHDVEARHLVGDSGASVVFADERYRELIAGVLPSGVRLVMLGRAFDALCAELEPRTLPAADVDDADTAILMYTSGTTSLPKGVMLSHGALSSYVLDRTDPADGSDQGTTLAASPLYHIAGLSGLLLAVFGGRRVSLLPQFEARAWFERVRRDGVTHAFLVPTMLATLLEDQSLAAADLSSLRSVSYGAAPMPRSVIAKALQVFPPHVQFSGSYGLSETTATVTVLEAEDHRRADGSLNEERLSSVGRPVAGVELEVRDPSGATVPAGEVGEVHLRTGRSMSGYWGEADARAKVTIDEDDWLTTGDLGRIDEDGYLYLVGRNNDMIIRGGENVAPEEIEQVLYAHPDVIEVGVFGVDDVRWGQRVVAAVVLREDSTATEATLREHCASLATFKRPESFLFLDELPRTSTGKLVRRRLQVAEV